MESDCPALVTPTYYIFAAKYKKDGTIIPGSLWGTTAAP